MNIIKHPVWILFWGIPEEYDLPKRFGQFLCAHWLVTESRQRKKNTHTQLQLY